MTTPADRDALARLVDEQAEDDGLWFIAETAPEAYLQQELRRLHAAIETAGATLQAPQNALDVERLRKAIWGVLDPNGPAEINTLAVLLANLGFVARMYATLALATTTAPVREAEGIDVERLREVAREAARVSQWHGAIGSGPLEVLDAELGDLGRHARSVLAEPAPPAEGDTEPEATPRSTSTSLTALLNSPRFAATSGVILQVPGEGPGRVWAEQVIHRWQPDEISEAVERKARELAGSTHRHGAIPARFWREAIAVLVGHPLGAKAVAPGPHDAPRRQYPEPMA